MFVRLTALADRMSVLDSIFVHELTSEPLSLFFNGQMRKNQKCNLRKLILFEEPNIETTSRPHSVSIIFFIKLMAERCDF